MKQFKANAIDCNQDEAQRTLTKIQSALKYTATTTAHAGRAKLGLGKAVPAVAVAAVVVLLAVIGIPAPTVPPRGAT